MSRVETALLSAYDKTGVIDLAHALVKWGATIVASGGTARVLREAMIPALSVEDLTGLAPGFGGRVKTLHPNIHAGILARRDVAEDLAELERAGARPIDLVYVNLYPFEEAVREGADLDEKIEKIDVGGPTMLRDPDQIPQVISELEETGGTLSAETRRALAAAVFARTSAYDRAIAGELKSGDEVQVRTASLGSDLDLSLEKISDLRYGENPHQRAALYRRFDAPGEGLPYGWKVLGGEELSYNNWVDLAAAAELAFSLPEPAAVIVKHTNPCGAATAATQEEAWEIARAVDPVSAFGGIAAFNTPLSPETADLMASLFLEIVVAPGFTNQALARLSKKPRLRVVQVAPESFRARRMEWKTLPGGLFLAQDDPGRAGDRSEWKVMSKRAPTEDELRDLEFAWAVSAAVKSNAIVFARGGQVLGVGAGQMSRVDSVRIAIEKAKEFGHDLAGSVVASDAFFPFADGPKIALAAGATAIAQPGGSKRDAETVAAVDEAGAAMVFTGRRVFRH
jgi:phosphoribosylaminoimidazolecarboxamide formyltransferase/IMP cyclohydrolase